MRIIAVSNIYPSRQNPTSGTFVEQQIKGLREIGVEVDLFYVDRAEKGMTAYFGLGSKVCNRVKEIKPDLVHVFYGGVMADQVTRASLDVPTVVSFCGSDLLGQQFSGFVRHLLGQYGVLASWNAAKRSHGIIVKSQNLVNALPPSVDRTKVEIIPNGIDFNRFKPLDSDACRLELGWKKNSFHVLFAYNTGDRVKRPALARNAVDKVQQLGIPAELHILRDVPHHKVPIWLNASDTLLLTSSHEGSPNIIKEALACDRPIVSVDVGDVGERIHGIEGCHIARPEPDDLAAKLSLIHARKPKIAGRIGIADLSLERTAIRLEQFYRQVLEQKSNPPQHWGPTCPH
jgi:teichuronic acid biosynthesis glycosyltransferase TuaC